MIERLGKYQIEAQIGRGGMGAVYRALDPLLKRQVALKVISENVDVSDDLRARFFREAQACAQLSHQNIITIYDLGEDEGRLFIVMEYLEGEELKQIIAQRRDLPLESKLSLMMQVCDGLAYAHAKGIVHRDIKPGNVFVLRGGTAKVLDFGVARLASAKEDLTRAGLIMGTLRYMSPEQVRGRVDLRSDMFSAGAVFYELMAHRAPVTGDDPMAILEELHSTATPSIFQPDPAIPADLGAVIERALRKNPDERFRDMTEMREALEAVRVRLAGEAADLRRRLEAQAAEAQELRSQLVEQVGGEVAPEALSLPGERAPVVALEAALREGEEVLGRLHGRILQARALRPEYERAKGQVRFGQWAAAAEALGAIVARMPEHAGAQEELARARAEIARAAEARQREREAAEEARRLMEELRTRAGPAAEMEDPEAFWNAAEASRASGLAAWDDQNFATAHQLFDAAADRYRAAANAVDRRVRQLMVDARGRLKQGQLDASLSLVEGVLALVPDHPEAGALLGEVREGLRAEAERRAAFELRCDAAQRVLAAGDLQGAIDALTALVEEDADHMRARQLLSEACTRLAEEEARAARLRAEEEARARQLAEEEARAQRLRAEEEARAERLRAEEEARARRAEEEARAERLRAEEEARARRAEEEARAARLRVEEEARARQRAEEEARAQQLRAEEEARAERLRAEEEARVRQAEEQARVERARAEEQARAERARAEEQARAQQLQEERARAERLRAEAEAHAQQLRAEAQARQAEQEARGRLTQGERPERLAEEDAGARLAGNGAPARAADGEARGASSLQAREPSDPSSLDETVMIRTGEDTRFSRPLVAEPGATQAPAPTVGSSTTPGTEEPPVVEVGRPAPEVTGILEDHETLRSGRVRGSGRRPLLLAAAGVLIIAAVAAIWITTSFLPSLRLQREVDQARQHVVAAREEASKVKAADLARDLFGGAAAKAREGEQAADAGLLEAALVALREAAARYEKAGQAARAMAEEQAKAAEKARAEERVKADEARSAMVAKRGQADPETSEFKEGLAREAEGEAQYERLAFRDAAESFSAAGRLFATPRPPARVPPPPPPSDSEIRATLGAYVRAYQSKDVAGLQRVWSGMTAEELSRLRAFFEQARSIRMTLKIGRISVNGDDAEATGRREAVIVTNSGETVRRAEDLRFRFKRSNDRWTIASVAR